MGQVLWFLLDNSDQCNTDHPLQDGHQSGWRCPLQSCSNILQYNLLLVCPVLADHSIFLRHMVYTPLCFSAQALVHTFQRDMAEGRLQYSGGSSIQANMDLHGPDSRSKSLQDNHSRMPRPCDWCMYHLHRHYGRASQLDNSFLQDRRFQWRHLVGLNY